MNYIKFFKDIDKNSVALAGGKGASLGEMSNSNFPIPNGFVVLSTAFEKFITESKIDKEITKILSQVNTENNSSVEKASKDIQKLILDSSLSKDLEQEILNSFKELNAEFVAVRSSATAEDSASDAWAGQLDSYLNTREEDLLLNVKRCFASLFTERAIIYRIDKQLVNKKISVAVVVQKMVNSEKSGIAFSVHPVTNDYNQMIIEAGYGLGEAIVSGQITPDSYIVSKTREILDKVKGSQEKALYRTTENQSGNVWKETTEEQKKQFVLTDKEIQELSIVLLDIEEHYGFPVDVEWAMEEERFYIVQSRPITTLEIQNNNPIHRMIKLFTREHSIFYSYIRKQAEYVNIKKYCGAALEDVLDIYLPNTNIIAHYYREDLNDISNYFLLKKYQEDKDYFKKVKKDIYEYWDKVGPYIQKQKKVETINELKLFYQDMIDYHTRVAVINVAPNAESLPQEIRNFCLDIRKDTQLFVEGYDEVMLDFFSRKHPEYTEIVHHMLPEEMFTLEKRKLTEKEIEKIKQRKENGSFVFNTTFYDNLKELKPLLDERNLELDDYSIIEKKKVSLQKLFTRERNVFYMTLEYVTNNYPPEESILGANLNNFMYISRNGLVDCLYDLAEIQHCSNLIVQKSKDPNFFKTIFSGIYNYWDTAELYLSGKKVIKSIPELEEFYKNYFDCLMYLTIIYICPEIKELDEKYKQQALECRLKTQHAINNCGDVINYLFDNDYKEYKEISYYMLPSEIFTLRKRKLTEKEIEVIKDRKENGYIFFRSEIHPYKELPTILDKANISVPESYYKIKLQREHSRSYSFFRIFGIYQGILNLYKYIDLPKKEMCFVYKGKDIVDVNYQENQLKELFYLICKDAIEYPDRAKKGISIFFEQFNKLHEYHKGKKVQTIEELKDVFETYSSFCMYNGLVYIYPNLEIVPEEIRKLSLEAREKTQEYHEATEDIFVDFFRRKYPELEKDYRFILPEEVWNGDIEDTEKIIQKINERKKCYILYAGKLITGDVNESLHNLGLYLDDHDGSEVKEIKGQIAYKGKITGIVRIITSQKQISEFQEGEILVSPMTMPNYLSAIKKASAIVTDEGGITCHASIISRELKKPCIIGTKIATQVLKTGDTIEVDADNGVVKIL